MMNLSFQIKLKIIGILFRRVEGGQDAMLVSFITRNTKLNSG